MNVKWSAVALADLNRFTEFLRQRFPHLAPLIAHELIAKAEIIAANPGLVPLLKAMRNTVGWYCEYSMRRMLCNIVSATTAS
jgi:hypothetical protein